MAKPSSKEFEEGTVAMQRSHTSVFTGSAPGAVRRPHNFRVKATLLALACGLASNAHASMFQGETLDAVANFMSWVVLVIAPVIGITVFWLMHILPEKIAEKRQHPQAKAIQTLCLLSLVFGGMLWPLAWLWAYSKPVLYKLAYGTDRVPHGEDEKAQPEVEAANDALELQQLRERIKLLEARLTGTPSGNAASGG